MGKSLEDLILAEAEELVSNFVNEFVNSPILPFAMQREILLRHRKLLLLQAKLIEVMVETTPEPAIH